MTGQARFEPDSIEPDSFELDYDEIPTPLGVVSIAVDAGALHSLDFADCADRARRLLEARYGAFSLRRVVDPGGLSSRVDAYFAGAVDALEGVPVETGGTSFQRAVWAALRDLGPGTTASYAGIAAAIGRPGAARAVGAANAVNPVALAVPCHRVVGSGGSLTGYAGGLARKRWLLDHERKCTAARNNRRNAKGNKGSQFGISVLGAPSP